MTVFSRFRAALRLLNAQTSLISLIWVVMFSSDRSIGQRLEGLRRRGARQPCRTGRARWSSARSSASRSTGRWIQRSPYLRGKVARLDGQSLWSRNQKPAPGIYRGRIQSSRHCFSGCGIDLGLLHSTNRAHGRGVHPRARAACASRKLNVMDVSTAVGVLAAICTTASYFPQLKKCWQSGETGDLSLWMFVILFLGLSLWMAYGFLRQDPVVLAANGVSLCCLTGILFFKIRGMVSEGSKA